MVNARLASRSGGPADIAPASGMSSHRTPAWERRLIRQAWTAKFIAVSFSVILTAGASAQEPVKLFDAHLHYNQEAMSLYPLERALDIFRRNGIAGILATSRPNLGTNQLFETKPPGLWVVPFLRP